MKIIKDIFQSLVLWYGERLNLNSARKLEIELKEKIGAGKVKIRRFEKNGLYFKIAVTYKNGRTVIMVLREGTKMTKETVKGIVADFIDAEKNPLTCTWEADIFELCN